MNNHNLFYEINHVIPFKVPPPPQAIDDNIKTGPRGPLRSCHQFFSTFISAKRLDRPILEGGDEIFRQMLAGYVSSRK